MHSANFKTKLRINAAFCAKIGYLSHAFLKYLKFQNHKCISLQSQNNVESFWNNNTAFKVKIGSVSHNIACLFSNLSEISKSSIYFCYLKTKLKVLETLTQLFMSKTWQSFVQRCVFPRVSFLSKFETLVKGLQLFWTKGPRTIFHKVLKFPFRTKVEKVF